MTPFGLAKRWQVPPGTVAGHERSVAAGRGFGQFEVMSTLTIQLEDELARFVEESARREHKTISDWVRERVEPAAERARLLAQMERRAMANGYPAGWLAAFGSLAGDESFVAPARGPTR